MTVGALLLLRNRNVAILLGSESHVGHWGFMTSTARQNIAIVGTALFIGGLVFFSLL